MRSPDAEGAYGKAWLAPLDRVAEWVAGHPERMHQTSREQFFADVWKALWYVRLNEQHDLGFRHVWYAVILRDLRNAPAELPRFYAEAEFEVVVWECKHGTPPLNGDGVFEQVPDHPPTLLYQFHGLSERQACALGHPDRPISFAQYVVEAMLLGVVRGDDLTWSHHLSQIVNGIREDGYGEPARRPLEVASRTGLLIELEDESTITLPVEVPAL